MRLRLGLIIPSSNTAIEPITAAMFRALGANDTVHFARVKVTRIGLGADELAQFDHLPMLAAARLLADSEVDAIAWCGTSGSWIGLESDRELCRQIESETGIPATTASLAIVDALHAYGTTAFGLAVPYVGEVAERIVDTYREDGLECAAERHLGITVNADFARLTRTEIEVLVRGASAGSQAVAIVCTNLPAAPMVEELEAALGIPVIDSIAATVWKVIDRQAPDSRLAGWGDLVSNGSVRARVQPVIEGLLEATGASRTTLRLDLPSRNLHVDRVAAEACAPGVKSIRSDGSLDQWAMPTVKWIAEHRRLLVQDDFATHGPPVSPALVAVYGVQAQMLGPVLREGRMVGWLSVHQVGRTRLWSDVEKQRLSEACASIEEVLDVVQPQEAMPARDV
jgi:maleate isomerase